MLVARFRAMFWLIRAGVWWIIATVLWTITATVLSVVGL